MDTGPFLVEKTAASISGNFSENDATRSISLPENAPSSERTLLPNRSDMKRKTLPPVIPIAIPASRSRSYSPIILIRTRLRRLPSNSP